jgi:hypothetical protein
MTIVISEQAQEVLWGFAKLGISVAVSYKCKKCKQWVKIWAIPNKRLRPR